MKNKKIIGAVVLIAVVGILGFIFKDKIFGGNKGELLLGTDSPKTLKELLSLGTAQKCTYQGGTLYIASGKVRGDFNPPENSEGVATHMITEGNTSYVWTDGSKEGFKTTFDTETVEPEDKGDETTSTEPLDASQPEDYVCSAWIVDGSVFVLPEGVNFIDVSSMIPTTQSTSSDTQTQSVVSQCSYCDSLSGDQKGECLSALNCE